MARSHELLGDLCLAALYHHFPDGRGEVMRNGKGGQWKGKENDATNIK